MSESTVFVHTTSARKSKWSRYVFPFAVEAFSQLADALFVRAGDSILRVDEDATTDEYGGVETAIPGHVQWGWLDAGQPGVTKEMEGFDVVGSGEPSVSIGYDQRNLAAFTAPYAVDPDTLPGDIIPLFLAAPTLAVKVEWAEAPWTLSAVNLYLSGDQKATT